MMLTPLVCLALAWNEPSAAELVTRHYPLHALRSEHRTVAVRTLPLREADHEEFDVEGGEEYALDPNAAVELVRNLVAPDEWEYEGRGIDVLEDAVLEVTAPGDVHQQVDRLVRFLLDAAASPVTVRADVYRVTGEGGLPPPPTGAIDGLARRGLEERLEAGALRPDASFRVPLLPGAPTIRTALETVPYLRDYDAELAEAAAVLDPVIDTLSLGVAAGLRADRTRDGDVVVSFVVRNTWLEEFALEPCDVRFRMVPESQISNVPGGGMLQVPRVGFASLAGSMRLAEGETGLAAIVSPDGGAEGRGAVLAITVEELPARSQTITFDGRTLFLADLGGETTLGLRTAERGSLTLRWPPRGLYGDPFLPALTLRERSSDGMDELHRAVDRARWQIEREGDHDGGAFEFGGSGVVYCFGPTESVRRTVALLSSMPREVRRRSVSIHSGDGVLAILPAAAGETFAVC
ncbi:MAG: hypothetical protein ACF8XB_05790, partial [Planctomycetota bacterium JB042]